MKIRFTKMQGCGNDYVYVNGFTEHIPQEKKPEFVRFASDRHFGVGGDGVIFINPSDEADFEMEMYNADGTRAEMCGNGIRCVAKYAHDKGLTDRAQVFHYQRRKSEIYGSDGGKRRDKSDPCGYGRADPDGGRGSGCF